MVWFSAIEEKNYSKIIELAAVFQGSRDKYGDTGLMLAARQGDTKVIQILLPYEAGLANDDNQTALIVAALCDKAKACRFLVASEKDCLLCDGRDALMLAAQVGNTSAVDALVDHFPAIRDNNGTSALDYAAGEGYLECVQLIVKRQDLTPDDLEHAVNIAMARKHFDIVTYLNTVRNTMFKSALGTLGDSSASDLFTSTIARTAKFAPDTLEYPQIPKYSETPMKLNRSVSDVSEMHEDGDHGHTDPAGKRLVNSASSERGHLSQSGLHLENLDNSNLRNTLSEAQRRVVQLTDTVNKIDSSTFNTVPEKLTQCQAELEQMKTRTRELEALIVTKDNEIKGLKEDLHFLLAARDEDNQLLASKNMDISHLQEEVASLKHKLVELEKVTPPQTQAFDKSVEVYPITRDAFINTTTLAEIDCLKPQPQHISTYASPDISALSQSTSKPDVHALQTELETARQSISDLERRNMALQDELLALTTADTQRGLPKTLTDSLGIQVCETSLECSVAIPAPVQPKRFSTSKIPTAPLSQVATLMPTSHTPLPSGLKDCGNDVEIEQLKLEIAQLTDTVQLLSEELIGVKDEKIQFEAEVEQIIKGKDAEIARLTLLLDSPSKTKLVVSHSTSMEQPLSPKLTDRSISAIHDSDSTASVSKGHELEHSLQLFTPLLTSKSPHDATEKQVKQLPEENSNHLSVVQQQESVIEPVPTAKQYVPPQSCVEVQTSMLVSDACLSTSAQLVQLPPSPLLSSNIIQTSFVDAKPELFETSVQTLHVESEEIHKLKEEHMEVVMRYDELKKKELLLTQIIEDNQLLTERIGVYEEELNHCRDSVMEMNHENLHLKQITETLRLDRDTLMTSYQELRAAFDEVTALKNTQDSQIDELKNLLSAQSHAFHAELDSKTRAVEGLTEEKHMKEIQISTLEHKLDLATTDMVNKRMLETEKMTNEELQARLSALDQEIFALKRDNLELAHDKKAVEDTLSQTRQDLISKEVKLDSTLILNEDLLKRLDATNESVATAKSKVIELEATLKVVTAENSTMKKALDEAKVAMEDSDNRLRHLSIEHSELLDHHQVLRSELDLLRNENHKLSTELSRATLDAKQSLEDQMNRELMHLRSELEVKTLSINKITDELSSTIRSKEDEISELKQKVKKYKTAYIDSKSFSSDVIKEATAQELAKYEHGLEIAHKEVLELRMANAELKAALEIVQSRSTEAEDLKHKSKKYKDGYVRKCKQLEELEKELEGLRKEPKTISAQSRIVTSADVSIQTCPASRDSKEVTPGSACATLACDEPQHDAEYDNIVNDLNTRLNEQIQETSYFRTRAEEYLNNYNIVREELLSTREQLEAHIRVILEKENEIDGLKLLISKLQGESPDLQKAMEDVALSALNIDEEQYNNLIEQVNRSIETSLLNKSASLNTSLMANKSIGIGINEKSLNYNEGEQSIRSQQACLMSHYTMDVSNVHSEPSNQEEPHDIINEHKSLSDNASDIRNLQYENSQLSAELSQIKEAYKALVYQNNADTSAEAPSLSKLSGYTDLMTAVLKRDRVGLSVYIDQAGMTTPDGKTALMVAAECNNLDAVTRLLSSEAGMVSKAGETALSISLHNSHFAIADLLVKREGINIAGVPALRRAKGNCTESLATSSLSITTLMTPDNGLTDLMMAVQRNDIVAVYCLLPLQAGVQDRNGYTALMYAAEKGAYPIVRILAELGDEAGKQNLQGGSALMLAARNGHLSICQFLADKECGLVGSPDSLLAPHQTALMLACFYGHLSIVRLLFHKEKSIVSTSGKTALSYARYPCSSVDFKTRAKVLSYVESNM